MWLQSLQTQGPGIEMLRDGLGYGVAVFGFPLAMHYVCRYIDRDARYNLMVAAVNWTAPWQSLLMAAGYLLYFWNLVPPVMGNLALLLASGFNMVYIWFVVYSTLAITRGMAVLIVSLMALIQLAAWLLTQITAF